MTFRTSISLALCFSTGLFICGYYLKSTVKISAPRILTPNPDEEFRFDSVCRCLKLLVVKKTEFNGENRFCSEFASFRGPGQKVLSFSLYGDADRYWDGIRRNIRDAAEFYPDHIVRIYVDSDEISDLPALCRISCAERRLDICDADKIFINADEKLSSRFPMTWRFAAMSDPDVVEWHSRDLDSVIGRREVEAVEDWRENSDAAFHVMRDHPWHNTQILGGLFGMRIVNEADRRKLANVFKRMMADKGADKAKASKGTDQVLLTKHLWHDFFTSRTVVHDSYTCGLFPGAEVRPFPFPRPEGKRNYVGSNGEGKHDVTLERFGACPEACRPRNHLEWKLC